MSITGFLPLLDKLSVHQLGELFVVQLSCAHGLLPRRNKRRKLVSVSFFCFTLRVLTLLCSIPLLQLPFPIIHLILIIRLKMVRIMELEDIYAGANSSVPINLLELCKKLLADKKLDNAARRKAIFRDVYYRLLATRKLRKGDTAVYPDNFKQAIRQIFPGDTANHDVRIISKRRKLFPGFLSF